MTDRQSRQIQTYAVLAVAFALPIVISILVLLGVYHLRPASQIKLAFKTLYELAGLLCLYLVLRHQNRRFKDIGLVAPPSVRDVGHGFALFFSAMFVSIIMYFAVYAVYLEMGIKFPPMANHSAALFGTKVGMLATLFAMVNPFSEELIVRAFLIEEFEYLYKSATLAVLASVGLQTSYHLYQGVAGALLHIPAFLIFSLYYVRTRRIFPVVIAHLLMDLTALAAYAHRLHG